MNRGHHLAEAAEELQADDTLARRLGEAGAALVARSLAPPMVQVRWRGHERGLGPPVMPRKAGLPSLGPCLPTRCCASRQPPTQPPALPPMLPCQEYWRRLLQRYRRLQDFGASHPHPDAVPLEESVLVPQVGGGRQSAVAAACWV